MQSTKILVSDLYELMLCMQIKYKTSSLHCSSSVVWWIRFPFSRFKSQVRTPISTFQFKKIKSLQVFSLFLSLCAHPSLELSSLFSTLFILKKTQNYGIIQHKGKTDHTSNDICRNMIRPQINIFIFGVKLQDRYNPMLASNVPECNDRMTMFSAIYQVSICICSQWMPNKDVLQESVLQVLYM